MHLRTAVKNSIASISNSGLPNDTLSGEQANKSVISSQGAGGDNLINRLVRQINFATWRHK
jgi:hypothetical protein